IVKGMARVSERDFGGRVELAKPPMPMQVDVSRETFDANPGRDAAALVTPSAPASVPADPPTPVDPAPPQQPLASIKVLSGANAVGSMPLTKEETRIGGA